MPLLVVSFSFPISEQQSNSPKVQPSYLNLWHRCVVLRGISICLTSFVRVFLLGRQAAACIWLRSDIATFTASTCLIIYSCMIFYAFALLDRHWLFFWLSHLEPEWSLKKQAPHHFGSSFCRSLRPSYSCFLLSGTQFATPAFEPSTYSLAYSWMMSVICGHLLRSIM